MKNLKKELMITLLGIVGILMLTIGVTYSFFNYTKKGATDNTITTGTIKFLYTETSLGRGIELKDAMPVSDQVGKNQTGEGKVFDFKITADTMKNTSIPYTVTVRKEEVEKELAESDVKLYITEVNSNIEENGVLAKFNDNDVFPKYNGSDIERVIYKGKVTSNTSDYIQNLRLRMWINEKADFSPLKDEVTGEYIIENGEYKYPNNNKTFKIKVNVYANGNVLTDTEVENESLAEMTSLKVGTESLTETTTGSKLYETTLPYGTTETEVEINTKSEYQKVKVEKTDSTYETPIVINNIKKMSAKKTLSLTVGENYFKITVTAEDGKTPIVYKLHITVDKNKDNYLSSLNVTNCTLSPGLNDNDTEYSCSVENNIEEVTVTAAAKKEGVTITGLGTKSLNVGLNPITLTTHLDGLEDREYNIVIKRKKEDLVLYDHGVDNTALTGGIAYTEEWHGISYITTGASVTLGQNFITLTSGTSNTNNYAICAATGNKVNLNGYTKLKVNFIHSVEGCYYKTASTFRLGISDSKIAGTPDSSPTFISVGNGGNLDIQTVSLDISKYQSDYFIRLCNNYTGSSNIYKIWLSE